MLPGAEYLVILNDRQLREAQMRQGSRKQSPRAPLLSWRWLTRLLDLTHFGKPQDEVTAQQRQALFGPGGLT